MKKIYNSLALVTLFVGSVAFAQVREYGLAGCGLGSLIFSGDTSTSMQVMAATTNDTSMSQAFGISSGTSGCVETDDMVASNKDRIQYFVDANGAALQKEAARGQGETLAGLSELLGCPSGDFERMMKSQYNTIFESQDTAASILNAIGSDSKLAKACS